MHYSQVINKQAMFSGALFILCIVHYLSQTTKKGLPSTVWKIHPKLQCSWLEAVKKCTKSVYLQRYGIHTGKFKNTNTAFAKCLLSSSLCLSVCLTIVSSISLSCLIHWDSPIEPWLVPLVLLTLACGPLQQHRALRSCVYPGAAPAVSGGRWLGAGITSGLSYAGTAARINSSGIGRADSDSCFSCRHWISHLHA